MASVLHTLPAFFIRHSTIPYSVDVILIFLLFLYTHLLWRSIVMMPFSIISSSAFAAAISEGQRRARATILANSSLSPVSLRDTTISAPFERAMSVYISSCSRVTTITGTAENVRICSIICISLLE